MFILPKVESFGEQFAKEIGSGAGQGMANSPNLLMDLLKQKRERQSSLADRATQLAQASGENLSLEDQISLLQKGQEIGKNNISPSDAQQKLLQHQIGRKKEQRDIQENVDPSRLKHFFTDPFTGENPEDRKVKSKNLQKTLNKSEMSTVQKRQQLGKSKKLGAEEIEDLVNPLSKEVFESANLFPDLTKNLEAAHRKQKGAINQPPPFATYELNEPQREFFKKNLSEILQKDPNANPLLLRREFEKKGVSWREFRDALNGLQEEGAIDLSASEDLPYLQEYLNKPPLGPLKQLLHSIKITGR